MKELKPGHKWMMVRNNSNGVWQKRIVIDVADDGVVAVDGTTQYKYFHNEIYNTTAWKYSKEMPTLQPLSHKDLDAIIGKIIRPKGRDNYAELILSRKDGAIETAKHIINTTELLNDYEFLDGSPICSQETL